MEKPIITISEGKIQGITLKSILGQSYLAFKSIPFAQPPIGPLRFRDPQQPLKWSGIRDASKHSGDCPLQYQTDGPKPYDIIGDEDCLYLNIYTNKIGHKRPVMFYIYGGGFVEGTGNDSIYREDYFMIKDVVLVYVNYRLGPMGFLNVGQEIASGNQGLKDILFALKWVQNNIEAFGGDPDNVTIFGHSAGSMICHLFTLLPATKGLFHKAILQSGLAILAKNLVTGKDCKNGFKVASLLGMDSNDPIKVVEFLRTVPAKKLISLQGHLTSKWEREVMDIMEYSPIVDVYYTKDPLIPSCINQLLKNDTNVPIIIGHTCDEALLSFMGRFDDLDNYKFYNDTIEDILKNKLISMEQSKFDEIMKYVQEYYLKNEPINTRNAWNLIRLLTDIFNACERKIVDLRNRNANAPTYVYNFSYMGNEPTIYQYDQGPQPYKDEDIFVQENFETLVQSSVQSPALEPIELELKLSQSFSKKTIISECEYASMTRTAYDPGYSHKENIDSETNIMTSTTAQPLSAIQPLTSSEESHFSSQNLGKIYTVIGTNYECQNDRGTINIMIPEIVAAFDKAKVSDRDDVFLTGLIAITLNIDLNTLILNRKSISKARAEIRKIKCEKME